MQSSEIANALGKRPTQHVAAQVKPCHPPVFLPGRPTAAKLELLTHAPQHAKPLVLARVGALAPAPRRALLLSDPGTVEIYPGLV